MLSNQNLNNKGNNEEIYVNDSRLQRIGLYISDTFDQTSFETVDFTEEEINAYKNVQSQLVRTRMVPVRAYRTPKPTTVLSDGFNSIQIISNDADIGHDLVQTNSNPDGTQRSVYLMNDNVKMLARRKCVLQAEKRQKVESDEYHAVIVHEPEAKIPRPPNAFMIFANEWRKKVAHKFNNESNKDISVRLGQMWRSLDKSRKEEYFVMARKADAEHKMKYPDYVYNPKEARLRKALRDSWKDKGKHTLQDPSRCIPGKSNAENWLSPQSTQNRKLLPMPSVSSMTFSMAADGYSMMETPAWSNSWYPYRHSSVPYLVPQISDSYTTGDPSPTPNQNYSDRLYHQQGHMSVQQPEARSSVMNSCRSPFASANPEPEVSKEPLSQLQELANVFSPASVPCTRAPENESKEFPPSNVADVKFTNSSRIKVEVETSINHDSDSGYVTDHPQPEGTAQSNDFGKNVGKTGVSDVLMTENNGEPFIETFEGNNQSNYIHMDDVFLDCNFLSGEKNFGSNNSLDTADQGKNVLPGFQQAFGSTEIGRFSRNDFFTNPPPDATEKNPSKILKMEPHSWNLNPNLSNFHAGPPDAAPAAAAAAGAVTPGASAAAAAATASSDYFSELCDIEESFLQSHPILADPDFLNVGPTTKKSSGGHRLTDGNGEGTATDSSNSGGHCFRKHGKGDGRLVKRAGPREPTSGSEPMFRGDELLDMLSNVIDDIDDFNVDELLVAGSDKFNLGEVNHDTSCG